MKYRLFSQSSGEYLEKMAVGLMDNFISDLNSNGYKGNYTYYYHVSWEWTGKFQSERVYTIELYEGTTIEDVIRCFKKAYDYRFIPLEHYDIKNQFNIRVSIEDYSWDKYHQTFLKVMKIFDESYYKYHNHAIKFWLKNK